MDYDARAVGLCVPKDILLFTIKLVVRRCLSPAVRKALSYVEIQNSLFPNHGFPTHVRCEVKVQNCL
jgi:hypothetical protein